MNERVSMCKKNYEVRPSKEIWDYYSRNSVGGESGITIDLILSSIADKLYGFHISYSATELLKDLEYLTDLEKINKRGRYILAVEIHNRYHHKKGCLELISPYQTTTTTENK